MAASMSAEAGFFARYSVAELAAALRAGRTSSVALVERALDETVRWRSLNAFVTVDADGARRAASRVDGELAAGVDRGLLHGIPLAVKDVIATAGVRTTMGSRHFADHVPARDAACVRGLRSAGAVIVGKTTTHEFAYGPTGDRALNGAARNPYRLDRLAGGSSGGSAAAVAAGVVPLAIGTDTGGSTRIPAACCGIVGLKPTYGKGATDGLFPLAPSLDTVGPMARTAADCRVLWEALLSGRAATRTGPRTRSRPLRIGWVATTALGPIEDAVATATRNVVGQLQDAGAAVTEVAVPDVASMRSAYASIQGWEAASIHADRLARDPGRFDDEVLARLQAAALVSRLEYRRARRFQRRVGASIAELFRRVDVLALPTLPVPAPKVGSRTLAIGDQTVDVREALLSLTSPWSVAGVPALTAPAGFVDGLPVGLQLVAPAGAEDLLLTVAESIHDSGSHNPPCHDAEGAAR